MVSTPPPPKVCPLCGKAYNGHPAISRIDNRTEICPECGYRQALDAAGLSSEEQDEAIQSIRDSEELLNTYHFVKHFLNEHELEIDIPNMRIERIDVDHAFIYGRESLSGRRMVILSQTTQCDDESLTDLLEEAAKVNADIVIWITGKASETYKNTIKWLDDNSDERTVLSLMERDDTDAS